MLANIVRSFRALHSLSNKEKCNVLCGQTGCPESRQAAKGGFTAQERSAPDTFAGGALTVAGYPNELHRDIGDVVIFPSFLAHKVTTVTRGTRHTMIAWAHGTPFR